MMALRGLNFTMMFVARIHTCKQLQDKYQSVSLSVQNVIRFECFYRQEIRARMHRTLCNSKLNNYKSSNTAKTHGSMTIVNLIDNCKVTK